MNLAQTIDHVLDLTRTMQAALDREDTSGALEIVPIRGLAMERFQEAHRTASPQEKAALAGKIIELKKMDEKLQDDAAVVLQATEEALHKGPVTTTSRAEASICRTSCLDRRA